MPDPQINMCVKTDTPARPAPANFPVSKQTHTLVDAIRKLGLLNPRGWIVRSNPPDGPERVPCRPGGRIVQPPCFHFPRLKTRLELDAEDWVPSCWYTFFYQGPSVHSLNGILFAVQAGNPVQGLDKMGGRAYIPSGGFTPLC